MEEIILKVRYFERGLSKSLTFFFFRTQSLLMNKVITNKRESETSDQSLFRSQNKLRKIPLFVIYYLSKFDDVM